MRTCFFRGKEFDGHYRVFHCKDPVCVKAFEELQRKKRRKNLAEWRKRQPIKYSKCTICGADYVKISTKKTCGDPICEGLFKEQQEVKRKDYWREWNKVSKSNKKLKLKAERDFDLAVWGDRLNDETEFYPDTPQMLYRGDEGW